MDIEGKTLVAYRRLFDDALFAAMENVRRNEKKIRDGQRRCS